jgi:cadmium resistance protein CadD (predicted permease)
MDPKDGGSSQIGISVTAMLTLIAYTFAIGNHLPKVAYLTRLDHFVLASTVLVFLALMEVVVASFQVRCGRVELARRIDRWARWCFPLMFVLIILGSIGPGLLQ